VPATMALPATRAPVVEWMSFREALPATMALPATRAPVVEWMSLRDALPATMALPAASAPVALCVVLSGMNIRFGIYGTGYDMGLVGCALEPTVPVSARFTDPAIQEVSPAVEYPPKRGQ